METDMIKITHLKKSFGDNEVLKGIDYERQRNGSDPGHRSG